MDQFSGAEGDSDGGSIMINSSLLFDAWLWVAIIVKWWLIASIALLFFLVATQRPDKVARRQKPPGHSGLSGGLRLRG